MTQRKKKKSIFRRATANSVAALCVVGALSAFDSAGFNDLFGADGSASDPASTSTSAPVRVRVATDSENAGYEAFRALDGDVATFWHTQFSQAPFEKASPLAPNCGYGYGCNDEHPKRKASRGNDVAPPAELRVDLGAVYPVDGVVYIPRADGQGNGLVGEYEVFAFDAKDYPDFNAEAFVADGVFGGNVGAPVASGTFDVDNPEKAKLAAATGGVKIAFEKSINARYLVFRAKTEVAGKSYSAVAELIPLVDDVKFVSTDSIGTVSRYPASEKARKIEFADAVAWVRGWVEDAGKAPGTDAVSEQVADAARREAEICANSPYFADLVEQFNRLVGELGRADYYAAIADQLPSDQAGILPTDRDPVDVVFRRTRALWLASNDLDASIFDESASNSENDAKFAGDLRFWRGQAEALDAIPVEKVEKRFQFYLSLSFLRRSLLFQRPELDFDRILFVKRNRARYSHICDQFYGRSAEPGGGLFALENPFAKGGAADSNANDAGDAAATSVYRRLYSPVARDLLADSTVSNDSRLKGQKLQNGAFIAPELSFDGQKIAFAYCECEGDAAHVESLDLSRGHTQPGRCYHLFTCDADGSNLAMISDGTWNDFDPCFLPNGRLAFISERRGGYLRCGRDCPNYTLFDADQDGSRTRCLSLHETNEWAPSVANDGQILWTRWDYIDRFGCIAHCPWTTTPDGRNPRQIHGNYAPRHLRADSELDVRAIPGSEKLIATAGPHHGQSFGSIIRIDPRATDDATSPLTRMTPDVGFPESQNGAQVWGTPWALADDLFLAVADYSFAPGGGTEGGGYYPGNYGIYLADALGNRELIYRDPEIGCSTPIPFVERETPPVVPSLLPESEIVGAPFVTPPPFDGERPQGVVQIQNVYEADRPFPAGTKIASIRVVQLFCMSVPSGRPPYEIGVREKTSLDSVKLARRVWGTAPVEEDGSACFYVPADCEIYFQALDENGVAVGSMRSGTALRAGESLSCVGCHEPREAAPTPVDGANVPLALKREPSKLTPEGPGTQPVNFPELVQPILDARCVECHNSPDSTEKGAPNLNREPKTNGFYASYWNLVAGGFAFDDFGDPLRTDPARFGARASRLYSLLDDHYGVELTDAERRRIALWLDTTSNFYGVYDKEGCEKEYRGEKAVPTLE